MDSSGTNLCNPFPVWAFFSGITSWVYDQEKKRMKDKKEISLVPEHLIDTLKSRFGLQTLKVDENIAKMYISKWWIYQLNFTENAGKIYH